MQKDAPPVLTAALAVPAGSSQSPRFSVDVDSGVLYGLPSLDDHIYGYGKVSRREALRVPAVKRARDLICGTIGQFPLRLYDAGGKPVDWALLGQPEDGVPGSVSWARVVEGMLLSERAWIRTTHTGWHGRPVQGRVLDPETVTIQPDFVSYREGTATAYAPSAQVIRFDSPNDGVLTAGSRAIRALTRLEVAALNYAEGTPPQDWFESPDGVDPFEDDEHVDEFLDGWTASRRTRATAYVPGGLSYKQNAAKAVDMQLSESRQHAVLEIARLCGVEAEDLGVSTTSRTYFNATDRRRAFLENTLGPFMRAIEERLGMDDVTPHGFTVRFDTSGYLSQDPLTEAQADVMLIGAGVLSIDEVRAKRGLSRVTGDSPSAPAAPEPAALQAPQETA
ncbi:MAG: phage portal protein [Streptomyces sp.]|nr:phage portal protein [Streptomyces sp.]